MKALMAAVLLFSSAAVAGAQEFVAPQGPREIPVTGAPAVEPPVTTEGIVAKIFNVEKPWQLLNPAAPKSYGNGTSSTSWSENDPGKPKGFILFGIEFW